MVDNTIYQPLGLLKCNVSHKEMWDYAKKRAIEFIDLIEGTGMLEDRICGYSPITVNHKEYWVSMRAEVNKS